MASISLQGLTKSYGQTAVIHGVDVDIADGELIVIVGPSGCGKSTLLRMVAGLEEVTGGTILINGKEVNHVEPKDRDIAMVFQTYALYPHMTVFNNMAYGLKIAKLARAEIKHRVEAAAEILELGDLLERKPKELSGGQRQRVAMGRAIVRKPSVFLFDEPLSNLDALLRVQMRLEIKQLQRRLGITALYVTHDQVEAMTLADRLVVMKDGFTEQIDTPLEIYRKPASIFVAGFIGSPGMNFLEGVVSPDENTIRLVNGDVLSFVASNAISQTSVMLGLRPEHLIITDKQNAQFAIKIVAVETLGADTLAHGVLISVDGEPEWVKGQPPQKSHRVTVRVDGAVGIKVEEIVFLTVGLENIHLFDDKSGLRISS